MNLFANLEKRNRKGTCMTLVTWCGKSKMFRTRGSSAIGWTRNGRERCDGCAGTWFPGNIGLKEIMGELMLKWTAKTDYGTFLSTGNALKQTKWCIRLNASKTLKEDAMMCGQSRHCKLPAPHRYYCVSSVSENPHQQSHDLAGLGASRKPNHI